MAKLVLGDSVGRRGENDENDVLAVRKRMRELGFFWIPETGGGDASDFVRAIKLFQAICRGHTKLKGKGVDGVIGQAGFTHQWLAAVNAPCWVKIYGKRGCGWQTTEEATHSSGGDEYTLVNGGYGTSWTLKYLNAIGIRYLRTKKGDFPPMWVRDCAREKGGKPRGHESHQTGLDIDMRLPLNPVTAGTANPNWTYLGTRSKRRSDLYRDAVKAQLEAIVAPTVDVVGYEDDTTPRRQKALHRLWAKVKPWSNHEHHFHIRISPPTRLSGVIA